MPIVVAFRADDIALGEFSLKPFSAPRENLMRYFLTGIAVMQFKVFVRSAVGARLVAQVFHAAFPHPIALILALFGDIRVRHRAPPFSPSIR